MLTRRQCLIGSLASCGLLSSPQALAQVLTAASFPLPPWNCDEVGEAALHGVGTRITRQILMEAGVPAHMSILPWARCKDLLNRGQIDLTWNIVDSTQRRTDLAFSDPVWVSSCLVFVRTTARFTPWGSWDNLQGKTLGVVRGYYYGLSPIALNHSGITLFETGNDKQLLSMLDNWRVDACLLNWQVFRHLTRGQDDLRERIVPCGLGIPDLAFHIAVSKRSPAGLAALPAINQAIAALRQRGIMQQILDEGLDPEPPPGVPPSHIARNHIG